MEKLEPLCTASGNIKWCSGSSEDSITGPQKIKHRMTLWSSNSSPRFIPQRIESRDSKRHLYTHVHNSIIYNNKRWKGLKGTSADGWIATRIVLEGTMFVRKRDQARKRAEAWKENTLISYVPLSLCGALSSMKTFASELGPPRWLTCLCTRWGEEYHRGCILLLILNTIKIQIQDFSHITLYSCQKSEVLSKAI